MDKQQMIDFILVNVKQTHNEKDMQDLLEFSDEELQEIIIDIIEYNS